MSICLLISTVCIVSCTKDGTIPDVDEEPEPVDIVYLDEKFHRMIWGGDYILQRPGVRGVFIRDEDNKWINDDTEPVSNVVPNLDGSSDFFDTVSEAYGTLRGLGGWDGWKVYERPGYLKLGTATSTDAYIRTPALEKIDEGAVEVKVSVDLAIWEGSSETITVNIVGGGLTSTNELSVTSSNSWTTKEFTISGATSNTRIELRSDPRGEGRFFVDNFLVVRSE